VPSLPFIVPLLLLL
jgi:hypothetical protein